MKIFKFLIIIIFFISYNINLNAYSIQIVVKVQNKIITNFDIDSERKYLLFLNPKLQELNNERINQIAKNSLITEIIKNDELIKYYNFDKSENIANLVEKNFLKRKGIKDKAEFVQILNDKGLIYDTIKKKFLVESLWNQLIFNKYSNSIRINEKQLRQDLVKQYKNKNKKYEYNLSEIFFTEDVNEEIGETLKRIEKSIQEIGFENTANIFSISSTSKNGGMIGWVNELQISNKIGKKVLGLNNQEVSEPIKMAEGYLIIKLNDKKEFKQEINIENQLRKLIENEKNRQLNTFSIIFFKRLKKNIQINEI